MPDADRTRMNPELEKEQAEGDRKVIEEALREEERTGATPRPDIPGHEQQGITNKPLDEEQRQQAELPPRGERKPDHA